MLHQTLIKEAFIAMVVTNAETKYLSVSHCGCLAVDGTWEWRH